jgi:hypothetical protein
MGWCFKCQSSRAEDIFEYEGSWYIGTQCHHCGYEKRFEPAFKTEKEAFMSYVNESREDNLDMSDQEWGDFLDHAAKARGIK